MGNVIVGLASSLYVFAAVMYVRDGNYAQAILFVGACIANIGAIWSSL